MGLKPGRTIRELRRPWTRTAKKKVKMSFVRGVPDSRLRAFDMGDLDPRKADIEIDLLSGGTFQIRDNAMESARVMANKVFEKKILRENYYFKVRKYPHQCLREHSMLTGAGADRLSSGMRKAFGHPTGRAVIAKKGECLMSVYTMKKFEDYAKEGFYRAGQKIPGGFKYRILDLKKVKVKFPTVKRHKEEELAALAAPAPVKTGTPTAATPAKPGATPAPSAAPEKEEKVKKK
ncbi:50S ribosomal protein L16 [Candidatus Micrarchaeota archaeon]|nr:50S ribosomal protein L16 [Candidatus Micrarchaeota archaeon]